MKIKEDSRTNTTDIINAMILAFVPLSFANL